VEEYSSYEDFYDECLLDLIFGDPVEDEIDALFDEELFRATGVSCAQLRQMAALREEESVVTEALRWRFAVQRKASRDRTKALRREATRKDEGLRRLTEYTDLLEDDVSRYTDAQLAEYKRDLDRRSRELFGGGGA
jgi:DNA-binding transcriptional MerR regulator